MDNVANRTICFPHRGKRVSGGPVTLTAVIWVTQALKQLDLMTSKGQTIARLSEDHRPGTPSLTAIIAPVALFAGVLYCLNKLNGDSELVVMSAAGISTARLLRPFLALFTLVFVLRGRALRRGHAVELQRDPDIVDARPGRFHRQFRAAGRVHRADSGFMFHYRERGQGRLVARRVHSGPPRPRPHHHLHRRGRAKSSPRTARPILCC